MVAVFVDKCAQHHEKNGSGVPRSSGEDRRAFGNVKPRTSTPDSSGITGNVHGGAHLRWTGSHSQASNLSPPGFLRAAAVSLSFAATALGMGLSWSQPYDADLPPVCPLITTYETIGPILCVLLIRRWRPVCGTRRSDF